MNTVKQIDKALVKMYKLRPLLNSDLDKVRSIIQTLSSVRSIKVAMAAAVTIKKIETELSILNEIKREEPLFLEVKEKLHELQIHHSEKLPTGEPRIVQSQTINGQLMAQYTIMDVPAFQMDVKLLEQTYWEAIQTQETKEKNYVDALSMPSNVSITQIERVDIKDIELTSKQMQAVFFLLKNGICKDDIPEDTSMEELLVLMDYFELD